MSISDISDFSDSNSVISPDEISAFTPFVPSERLFIEESGDEMDFSQSTPTIPENVFETISKERISISKSLEKLKSIPFSSEEHALISLERLAWLAGHYGYRKRKTSLSKKGYMTRYLTCASFDRKNFNQKCSWRAILVRDEMKMFKFSQIDNFCLHCEQCGELNLRRRKPEVKFITKNATDNEKRRLTTLAVSSFYGRDLSLTQIAHTKHNVLQNEKKLQENERSSKLKYCEIKQFFPAVTEYAVVNVCYEFTFLS
jgi:hypothetical protein